MLTERSIINFLIWIGGILLGPFLAYSLVRQNELPVLVLAGLTFLFFMFAIAKDMLCIAPLVGLCVAGTLRFIPGKPDGFEFGTAAAILYYVITYIALRRKVVLTGPLYFFIPLFLVAGIIYAHDPHASLRLAGGGREGGRGVVDIMLAAFAYLAAVSMNTPSARLFSLTPLFCIGMTILTVLPDVISTWIPKTAEFFYMFTDAVNVGAYVVDVLGGTADVVRNGGLSMIGSAVAVYLLSYFPITTWWRADRWWVALLVGACCWAVINGGFRSGLISFFFTTGLVIWCHSSWRALTLVPPIIAVIAMAVVLQDSHLINLPESAQRTLSFLPGDWDPDAVGSAKSSTEFRDQIRRIYLQEEAGKHPLFGNGITYDATEFQRALFMAQTVDSPDGYYGIKAFLAAKIFHIGWISAYDTTGLVGCFLLAVAAASLIWVSGRMVFSKQADRRSPLFPLKIWLFANVASNVFTFLTVFGDIKSIFPTLCVYAAVWTHLDRLEKFGYRPSVANRMVPFDSERANIPVTA